MANHQQQLLHPPARTTSNPVECLGLSFANDQLRREHFTNVLKKHLQDAAFRSMDGFPLGSDEDILRMSDPPYYTACPNPFVSEFVRHVGRAFDADESYHREPLAADVSEGKNDTLYSAHSYHTKVPPRAIARYVLHYTKPGDLVLDGFCGSGMTGVGCQMAEDPPADLKQQLAGSGTKKDEWGRRHCILSDLSPIASFLAYNHNTPVDADCYRAAATTFFESLERELGWMYVTKHGGKPVGRINFTVWSEVFLCPECSSEIVYTSEALDRKTNRVRDDFPCPKCKVTVSKRQLQKKKERFFDFHTHTSFERNRRIPVLINYTVGSKRHEKVPDADDLALIKKIEETAVNDVVPTFELPYTHMTHERVKIADYGVHRYHHFFFARQLHALAVMWRLASGCTDHRIRQFMLYMIEQCIWGMSIQNRYSPSHFSQVNRCLSGVYYMPSQTSEVSPWYILNGKYERLMAAVGSSWTRHRATLVSVSPCSNSRLPEASIDYIFTDPPFGENIYYADLNQLIEAWHRVSTNAEPEAIIDQAKEKGLSKYQDLMRASFQEYFRVLKPGRWMTVVFHNSHNSVWNAIQEAVSSAGFVVADVRTLDKQQSSYRQVTAATAVKQDLVITAYRPSKQVEESFRLSVGNESSAWHFVRAHLRQLPVFVLKGGKVEVVAERQNYMLYDRMVAFHVQRGYAVPLSSAEFRSALQKRFPERDGMYFLPEQVAEYDRKRMNTGEVEQFELFVSDEKTAIQWVRRQLATTPMRYQDLQPLYMREAQRVWEKHEQPIELQVILNENFVKDDDERWRLPDPTKENDLEQVRARALLKEFEQYRQLKGKLKVVRTEALRAGFKDCWQKGDYAGIVTTAKRVAEEVIQEDQVLVMYYDNALMRTEG